MSTSVQPSSTQPSTQAISSNPSPKPPLPSEPPPPSEPPSLWGVSSPAQVYQVLQEKILPKIMVDQALIPDQIATRYSTDQIKEPLPKLDDFPLYGAKPSNDPQTVYLEIFSSAEKANAQNQDDRWLVDVAEAFNARKEKTPSGQVIQVGIRNIPSGFGGRLIASQTVKPAGYTPSNELWLKILEVEGVKLRLITNQLVPNHTGFVIQNQTYQKLAANGSVTFDSLMEAILAKQLKLGYPNPYSSSSSLNLLYTLLGRAANHQDGSSLTENDLQIPEVNSVFQAFQEQVLITTLTSGELRDIFLRDPDKLQVFPIDYQSYVAFKKLRGFEQTQYIPFGVPHNNPLVGFEWNTPAQEEALKKFADFATSNSMQQIAARMGFETTEYLQKKNWPPVPQGIVLKSAQKFWKHYKDGNRKVYMSIVIDTSGSMRGQRISAVKEGLKFATTAINPGNYVGLITFGDQPAYRVRLAPFDQLQQQRLLAAIDQLEAIDNTALYDGIMVGLGELLTQQQQDPNGRFYLLVLTDGEVNRGFNFSQVHDLMKYSGVRIYPIAYGEVNQQELKAIAALRETTVQQGSPENVQTLLKDLFQTNL